MRKLLILLGVGLILVACRGDNPLDEITNENGYESHYGSDQNYIEDYEDSIENDYEIAEIEPPQPDIEPLDFSHLIAHWDENWPKDKFVVGRMTALNEEQREAIVDFLRQRPQVFSRIYDGALVRWNGQLIDIDGNPFDPQPPDPFAHTFRLIDIGRDMPMIVLDHGGFEWGPHSSNVYIHQNGEWHGFGVGFGDSLWMLGPQFFTDDENRLIVYASGGYSGPAGYWFIEIQSDAIFLQPIVTFEHVDGQTILLNHLTGQPAYGLGDELWWAWWARSPQDGIPGLPQFPLNQRQLFWLENQLFAEIRHELTLIHSPNNIDHEVQAIKDALYIGADKADVFQFLKVPPQQVYAAYGGEIMWRFDIGTVENYTFNTNNDTLDLDGLGDGLVSIVVFARFDEHDELFRYTIYYRTTRGDIMEYRVSFGWDTGEYHHRHSVIRHWRQYTPYQHIDW